MKKLVCVALLVACSAPPEEPAGRPPRKRPAGLPAGFEVSGPPRVEEAYLAPAASWRALRSRLTTLQADAVSRGADILVSFEASAVHATNRDGSRISWKLPEGLTLGGAPVHLLLGADYSARIYSEDHSQVPMAEEVTVVTARLQGAAGNVEKIRLTIKGGRTIRSISNAG